MANEPEPFDQKMENIKSFIRSCQIYMEIKHAQFPTQRVRIMWVLSYMTKGSADAWRENILDQFDDEFTPDPYTLLLELFAAIKRDFGDLNKRTTKVMALKKMQQGNKMCEEHIQEFKQVAWGSRYEGTPLIDEFKRSIHPKIRQRLMEAEMPLVTIDDWYRRAGTMDRAWRQSQEES